MTSKNVDVTGYYTHKLKAWPKAAGAKPTAANFEAAHASGLRPGSEVAFANALMHRADGMTRLELDATGTNPQFVAAARLERAGRVKRIPHAPRDGQMVYRIALAAKPAKADGGKAVAKAAKGKPAKAAKPTADKAPATPPPAVAAPDATT